MAEAPAEKQNAVLLAVGGLLGREVAIESLLRTLLDRVTAAMDADRGTLYLIDQGKHELFSRVAHLPPELKEIRLKVGQGIAGRVAASGEVVNVPTTGRDARFFSGVDEQTGYQTRSTLAAPMRDRSGTIIGVVQVLNKREGVFTREDEELLVGLAAQAGEAIEATTLYSEHLRPSSESKDPVPLSDRFNRIIGESEPMQQVYRLTTRAAASDATVLIRGESGTGKELFARAVHVNSPRRNKPFVKVDCAALPVSLIENELFGHEKGAFTGADSRALGKFDQAHGGTIFLDELGELPLAVQGKLLRVLQEREFDRVGGTQTVKVDVRVVAATNRDLEQLVAAGTFRADLYYRVKVVELLLSPLRVRGAEDIARLARHFVSAAAKRHGRPVPAITPPAMERLTAYSWPGNVRELENCLESAVVILDGPAVLSEHLPLPERASPHPERPARAAALGASPTVLGTLEDVERAHILAVMTSVEGNQSSAAKILGIGRNTLARKLKTFGM